MEKKTKLSIVRWIVTIILFGLTLYLINYSFFAAWAGGGPPNNYPEAWRYLSIKCFYFAIFTGLLSMIAFLTIGKSISNIKKIVCVALAVSACIAIIYPFGYKQMTIDSCLDSGGKWEEITFKCLK